MNDEILTIDQDSFRAFVDQITSRGIPRSYVALENDRTRITVYSKKSEHAYSLVFHKGWTSGAMWVPGPSGDMCDYTSTRLPAISEPGSIAVMLRWLQERLR